MRNVVVTECPRADLSEVGALTAFGVATVHEAIGRTGYLGPGIRPVHPGSRIGGTAVTVVCWPGDNLMIHAAVEQCCFGDVLVVTTTSPCAEKERASRAAFRHGELGLDRYGLRAVLAQAGVEYVDYQSYQEASR